MGAELKDPGVAREDIFISTKIWASQYLTEGTVEKSLELLGTDYIDLMFIHQPAGDFMAGYRKLEKAYKEGKIKAIGISNFNAREYLEFIGSCDVIPAINQVECHVYYRRKELQQTLAAQGTQMQAWSPFTEGKKNHIPGTRLAGCRPEIW